MRETATLFLENVPLWAACIGLVQTVLSSMYWWNSVKPVAFPLAGAVLTFCVYPALLMGTIFIGSGGTGSIGITFQRGDADPRRAIALWLSVAVIVAVNQLVLVVLRAMLKRQRTH